ncbi:2OG-Fe(II) oxygenase [Celerinatantimonas diazotrophica]|uniref:SM-20-related protein n=1 Tax=Celerinatantimonas diazotrophica TaxID=412034 RepID=A0A4R1J7G7_9GAMM|nr:2OG-Fe(II) oxygenase [Celerinatantimonas diazotrophica]TCK46440.1 SM-20-related protein [Celerinatantimonas diazotrophica]CAG9295183.1 hypothetical protein CEDIAZO_00295 [Celerinatantimonas diazotrophica]
MGAIHLSNLDFSHDDSQSLFAKIASDLLEQGYSIQLQALPQHMSEALYEQVTKLHEQEFIRAGVGRKDEFQQNQFIRRDEICWIDGSTATGRCWLDWTAQLQNYLNRRLFLGLFSFESHYAHYARGDFYKRHFDAFHGQSNRVLTVVTYLNQNWQKEDGGQMVLYRNQDDLIGTQILPTMGTIAVFLSEEFPHEVLPAMRDRYSIAGWYRLNNSLQGRIDPPR